MLNCKDVTARSSAFIEGDLSFWQGLQIHLHLAMCKGCSAFVEQMRLTHSLTMAAGAAGGVDELAMAAILVRLHEPKSSGD